MLRNCQHILLLMWTADAVLSGNITVNTIFFFTSREKEEMFQFFGERVRLDHLVCPIIKQTVRGSHDNSNRFNL